MKILVTRHGQTEWNVLGKLQGQTNIELNELGRQQAIDTKKLIQNEKVDLIITSSAKRAKETAEIINEKFNVNIIEDSRLLERRFGPFEGTTKKERELLKETNPEISCVWDYNKNIEIEDMESMKDFCNRIYEFLDEVVNKYKSKNKNILIVTHGGVSVVIKYYFNKLPLENFVDREKIKGLKNCEVIEFNI